MMVMMIARIAKGRRSRRQNGFGTILWYRARPRAAAPDLHAPANSLHSACGAGGSLRYGRLAFRETSTSSPLGSTKYRNTLESLFVVQNSIALFVVLKLSASSGRAVHSPCDLKKSFVMQCRTYAFIHD